MIRTSCLLPVLAVLTLGWPCAQARESNWLPAPNGPFWLAMRIYWPKPEALDGTWKQPPLMRAE